MQPLTEEFDETQNAILDGVLGCISNYGFGGVTTRRIADAANVNEVTIFRRFGSKNEVLKAAFRREAHFVQTEAVYYTGDLIADLHRIVATLWQAAGRRQSILPLLIAEIPRNPELREAAQASLQVIGQVLQIIQQYQAEGQLRVEPPLLTFATLIGPIVFINLLSHLQPAEGETFQVETYVQHFLTGHRASV